MDDGGGFLRRFITGEAGRSLLVDVAAIIRQIEPDALIPAKARPEAHNIRGGNNGALLATEIPVFEKVCHIGQTGFRVHNVIAAVEHPKCFVTKTKR